MANIILDRQTVITFPEDNIDDITTGIVDGSLLLSEVLFTDKIEYGEVNVNRFEASVYGLSDVAGKKIQVYQMVGNVQNYLFTGYVDSCKLDEFGYYRNIVAYDILYKASGTDYDIANWWSTYWSTRTKDTLGNLWRAMLTAFNISYVNVSLPLDNTEFSPKEQVQRMSLADTLSLLCQINMCVPNVTREGEIEFLFFRIPDYTRSISGDYNTRESTFESYTSSLYNRIEIYNVNGELGGYYGEGNNAYVVKDNMFIYGIIHDEYSDPQYDYSNIAYIMSMYLCNITYIPASINMIVSDATLKLGDVITTTKGTCVICEQEYSGPLLIEQTIISKGESSVKSNIGYNSETNRLNLQIGQLSEAFQNKIAMYLLFDNEDAYAINSTDTESTEIINIPFLTNKKCYMIFHADVISNIITDSVEIENVMNFNDGKVLFEFYINGEKVVDFCPESTYQDGIHTMPLSYSWYNEITNSAQEQSFVVTCKADDCEVIIPIARIHGQLTGDGLYILSGWDGRIIAEDEFENIELDMTPSIRDTYDVTVRNENIRTYTQILSTISLDGIVPTITDSIGQLLGMIFSTVVNLNLLTYTATISNNTFVAGEVVTPKIHNINSVSVISRGDVSFAVTFDSGTTWNEYANGQWVPGATMTKAEIESVPNSAWVGDAMIKAIIADDDISNLTQIVIEGGILV